MREDRHIVPLSGWVGITVFYLLTFLLLTFTGCLSKSESGATGLLQPPPDPTGFSGTADSTSQITLSWGSGGGSTAAYRVSYQAGLTAPADCDSGTTISETTLGSATSIAIPGMTGSVWSFRVCAVNANPVKDVSDGVTTTTYLLPPDPHTLIALSTDASTIKLGWSSGGGSTAGYRISIEAGSTVPADCSSPDILEGAITGTTHAIGGLTAGKEYSFRVCAVNGAGTPDVSAGVTATTSVWFDNSWTTRRALTFDNSTGGTQLDNFPVLVSLDSDRINYSAVQNAGEDLRFYDRDGNALSYEIENWDEGGISTVWVKVPRIPAGSSDDYIWMYYGNGTVADAQDPAGTWSEDYITVLHMEDTNPDDSLNANDGVGQGSTSAVSGLFANALHFTASNATDYIRLPASATLDITSDATIEGWFRVPNTFDSTSTTSFPIMEKFVDNANLMYFLLVGTDYNRNAVNDPTDGSLVFKIEENNRRIFKWTNRTSWTANTWYYFAATVDVSDNSDIEIYVNGVDDTSTTFVQEGANPPTNDLSLSASVDWNFGGRRVDSANFTPAMAQKWFNGDLDEIRISSGMRSAAWIRAQYLSMVDSFITFGAEEVP